MKILILGCGNIGSVAAENLAKNMNSIQIVVADKDETRAKNVADKVDRRNVSWIQLNAANHGELVDALKEFALAMGFLPGKLGYRVAEACIDAEKDLVDVSYMAENPLTLHHEAMKAGVVIIPDCGLAPGISNILVGHTVAELDKVEAAHIMVGGLPEKPVLPLDYIVTWSPESLIDEYKRKALIVKKGKTVAAEALTGLQEVEFPGVGKLEAFYTDGLRTLPNTITGVEDMWEKTLRYTGHAEKIRLLKTLGFFDENQVDVEGVRISPLKVAVKLFEQKLLKPHIRDIVALRVEVCGIKNGRKTRYTYHLLDRYDEKRQTTAMARTTSFTASITAQLILKKAIKEKGVVPPEKLGMDAELFSLLLSGLKKQGIKIVEERTD
ncbi:MAG: saccharopine dehydrogenase family protein [Candidatus Bathyarchaeota archaeon]|nr:saccharopine dehydrogenase family protein [Candidatus Bathyarchaeota archaeon]MDH5786669.1 saccharopine dehydrogenase family protein [Candidatus Bathyarchaeota archaeon]